MSHIVCPECESEDSIVTDSRPDGLGGIRRRRRCPRGHRYTTREVVTSGTALRTMVDVRGLTPRARDAISMVLKGLRKLTPEEESEDDEANQSEN